MGGKERKRGAVRTERLPVRTQGGSLFSLVRQGPRASKGLIMSPIYKQSLQPSLPYFRGLAPALDCGANH